MRHLIAPFSQKVIVFVHSARKFQTKKIEQILSQIQNAFLFVNYTRDVDNSNLKNALKDACDNICSIFLKMFLQSEYNAIIYEQIWTIKYYMLRRIKIHILGFTHRIVFHFLLYNGLLQRAEEKISVEQTFLSNNKTLVYRQFIITSIKL